MQRRKVKTKCPNCKGTGQEIDIFGLKTGQICRVCKGTGYNRV